MTAEINNGAPQLKSRYLQLPSFATNSAKASMVKKATEGYPPAISQLIDLLGDIRRSQRPSIQPWLKPWSSAKADKTPINRGVERQYLLNSCVPEQKRAIVKKNFRQPKGQDSPNWKGGRELTKAGYVRLSNLQLTTFSEDGVMSRRFRKFLKESA